MQKMYMCHCWDTWDGWMWVRASSPALAALDYYEKLSEPFKQYKKVYVLEAHQTPRVDSPKVFYIPEKEQG